MPLARRLAVALACLLTLGAATAPPSATAQDQPEQDSARCCGYHVTGYVWHDINENGIDDGEPPMAGWVVQVYNVDGAYLAGTEITDASGQFVFETPIDCANVDAVFTLVLQPGFSQTYPTAPTTYTFTGIGGCGGLYENVDFGVVGQPCDPHTETWTTDAEFNSGNPNGVEVASDDLQLTPTPATLGYAWIANTSEGTVSRVDIATGNEVGRYYTGPPAAGTSLYPSRTAVDADGNCWVLNRSFGGQASVTQILASGGVDRNASSSIETSTDNVTINGIIDPPEILPWGDDERVARHYVVGGAYPDNLGRALTIDKTGMLWVGLYNGERVVQLDPALDLVTYAPDLTPAAPPELQSISTTPHSPYGLALSPSGKLYAATLGTWALEIDPGLGSGGTAAGPAVTQSIQHLTTTGQGIANYGIAVDQDCVVWLTASSIGTDEYGCIRWDPAVGVGDPSLGWSLSQTGASSNGRGITVDYDGNIWMTQNDWATPGYEPVAKYAPTDPATFLGEWNTGLTTALGVGVGADGDMIITDSGSGNSWIKMDKDTGAILPLPGPQLAGLSPYTYSDFTGSLQSIVNEQQGFWTAISDAGSVDMVWNTVSWNATTPAGTSVEVEYRIADTLPTLALASWVPVASPGPIADTPGQFLEVRVRLVRGVECGAPWVTPVVHDVTVAAICDPCHLGPCTPIVVECEQPGGTVVEFPMPTWPDPGLCQEEGASVSCDPPSGSLFPVGTTTVTCTTISALGDTVTCQFPVVVTGDCDRVTGGCCTDQDCDVLTEAECDAIGGLYLGDGSDCEDGCSFDCQRPPRNMLAWFPLDDAPGGITPNLAHPPAPAVEGGSPTQLPTEWVTASYRFSRADQADEFVAADHPTLDFHTSDFTIDAWVRTSNYQGVNNILDKRQDSPVRGYRLYLANGYPALELANGTTSMTFALSTADGIGAYVANGNWRFLAVTVDRDIPIGVQFYVDGVPVGATANPTSVTGNAGSSADLAIGRSQLVGGSKIEWFDGDLDEIEVFRRKLSADEITRLYQAGPSGKCREACYVPKKISACHGNTASTSITICNYDDVPHLYSWGLTPSSAGCSTAATSFTPSSGSVTVGPGDCVSVPVSIQVPSSMPAGGTACFNVAIFNHDTGRYFGCTGEIRKNKWWCLQWKPAAGDVALPGFATVYPLLPFKPILQVAHIGPANPGTVLYAELRAVGYEDEQAPADNLSLNRGQPGAPLNLAIPIPEDGSPTRVQIEVEALAQQYLNADKLVLWADDDEDGTSEPISELLLHTTTVRPTVAPPTPELPGRSFRTVPNPFNPRTTLEFVLPGDVPMPVDLRIFDLRGRKVRTLYSRQVLPPGLNTVEWDGLDKRGRKVATGMYLVQLVTPRFTETVKAVLVK